VSKIGVEPQTSSRRPAWTLIWTPSSFALYVQVDDILKADPDRVPWRPAVGITPRITDAEVVTLAVAQALLGFTSEARWLRFGRAHLQQLFPYLPAQSGYNKRLRKLGGTLQLVDPRPGHPNQPVQRRRVARRLHPGGVGRSRETTTRSNLVDFAEYGYCASHSRYFWGLRLHLRSRVSARVERADAVS